MKNWLDDPEWEELKQRVDKKAHFKKPHLYHNSQKVDGISRASAKPKLKSPHQNSQLNINNHLQHSKNDRSQNNNKKVQLSLDVTIPKLHIPHLSPKQRNILIGLIVAMVAVLLIMALVSRTNNNEGKSSEEANPQTVSQTPEFKPILPGGKSEEVNSGEVRYDPAKKIVNFKDKITGVEVVISEQSLPDNIKKDADGEVEKIAKSFSADKIIYAGEVKAFYGVSEAGPQTIIFSKKDLLLFIYAPKELDKDGVVQYILGLE